jgi:chromosome segregation ATPase
MVKDFGFSRTALDAILARHHSYAASLNASTQQNAARSLQASLRVPAGELNAVVAELKSLGHVENETQAGEEVTQQHADLVARLKNSRETEQRLQAILMQRTGKISDVLAVEQEIARVRGEIEQMEAEQKALEHRVDFASIELSLAEEYKAQIGLASPSIATRIHNATFAGYRSAVESVVGIIIFFTEFGPSAMIWLAFLAPLAWFVRRRWKLATSLPS